MLRCNNDFRKRTLKNNCTPDATNDCYEYHQNVDGSYVDAECAEDDQINHWLQDKVMFTKVMNQQIDFEINNVPVRETERWLPSFPLKTGQFTDVGLRFRLNLFNMLDSWVPGFPNTMVKFFDLRLFSSDTMPTKQNNKYIATMYYRLDIDQVYHNRNVFVFMDWLGAIAGINAFLLKWSTFIFGGII